MKRSKEKHTKPTYRKISTGTVILRNLDEDSPDRVRARPNQEIQVTEKELGTRLDQFKLVKKGTGKYKPSKKEKEDDKPLIPIPGVYTLKHKGNDKYLVIDPSGIPVSADLLDKPDAQAIKLELEEKSKPEEE